MSASNGATQRLETAEIDKICDEFETAWVDSQGASTSTASRPRLEQFLAAASRSDTSQLLRELLRVDVYYRLKRGESVSPDDYADRLPEHLGIVSAVLESPDNQWPIAVPPAGVESLPSRIGRYRVVRLINRGSFGSVYLARDERLQRDVAIKVPHSASTSGRDKDAYLAEARILAELQHPNIVQVFDVGELGGQAFLVSQYIDGANLAQRITNVRLDPRQAAELIAQVADALHYAHTRGLVHRDVKPANILLDRKAPYLVDFGLALTEESYGDIARQGGTVAYMSPEQARGEGHRVDGRSDIFSLGTVFYELLTGVRPFRGANWREVLAQVIHADPTPPRMLEEQVPRELERICLKALSKRATDRYAVALDLKDDLHSYLYASDPPGTPTAAGDRTNDVGERHRVVPRGLRAFEPEDSGFFLQLLPGARDRDGLPESVRFWKSRIESTDPERTFRIGLIYGPSGCGKSSLVKAGLMPRLAGGVLSVYLDCSVINVESRLQQAVRKLCPAVSIGESLIETFATLRRHGPGPARKIVFFLDQFEHWLHARAGNYDSELTSALRQCDGDHVQCVLMTRDDFWLAVSRFLDELEIDLLESQNATFVDLFSPRHARQVLTEYGRAYGSLPEGELLPEHGVFLDHVVDELTHEGKIVPVRLSLFAEMIKSRPWNAATWKELKGEEGVGVRFLDDTFVRSGTPKHRQHCHAAHRVLKSLLPVVGSNIRDMMRSSAELKTIAGYADRPRDFEALLQILDRDTRLLSPVDPEGIAGDQPTTDIFYQLTHDYLVHSLRTWLTTEQRKTRRGRAELLLVERANAWQSNRSPRLLPTNYEALRILSLTSRRNWSRHEASMMTAATRRLRCQLLGVTCVAAGVLFGLYYHTARQRVTAAIHSRPEDTHSRVKSLRPVQHIALPMLREVFFKRGAPEDRLAAAIKLIELRDEQTILQAIDFIKFQLLTCTPDRFAWLRDSLEPVRHQLALGDFWQRLDEAATNEQTLRVASTLLKYDPHNPKWTSTQRTGDVARALLSTNTVDAGQWIALLEPMRRLLLVDMHHVVEDTAKDRTHTENERIIAANAIVALTEDPVELAKCLIASTPLEFTLFFDELNRRLSASSAEEVVRQFIQVLDSPGGDTSLDDDRLAKQQALSAIALLRLGHVAEMRGYLARSKSDPRMCSYFLNYTGRCGVEPKILLDLYDQEESHSDPDPNLLRVWIDCLRKSLSATEPDDWPSRLWGRFLNVFQETPYGQVHVAAEALLRNELAEYAPASARDELAAIKGRLSEEREPRRSRGDQHERRNWYVSTQGLTLIVVPAGEMPADMDYRLAVSAYEVTKHEFMRFAPTFNATGNDKDRDFNLLSRFADCPALLVTWYEAAAFCNWLSQQDGIPVDEWPYEITRDGEVLPADFVAQDYESFMADNSGAQPSDFYDNYWKRSPVSVRLKDNWTRRPGYALPTEHEWELLCKAGAVTHQCYGNNGELLGDYAWSVNNSTRHHDDGFDRVESHPVGAKLPNRFGIFDMHGNVYEWCQPDTHWPVTQNTTEKVELISRGGSYVSDAGRLRTDDQNEDAPAKRDWKIGFRVVRRLPLAESP